MGPLNISPIGFLSQMFWELLSSDLDPRGQGAWHGAPTPHSSGGSTCLSRSCPIVCCHTRWDFWQECFSSSLTHLYMVLFISWYRACVQLVLRFFSEGIDLYVVVYLLYLWEEVCSASSYAIFLNHPPNFNLYLSTFGPNSNNLLYVIFFKHILSNHILSYISDLKNMHHLFKWNNLMSITKQLLKWALWYNN